MRLEHLPADVLGLSQDARAALAGHSSLTGSAFPRKLQAFERPPDRFDRDQRAHISSALESGLAAYEPSVTVLDGVRALRERDACVVLTAHGPSFLASPLSVIYRALQTVRLAQVLQKAWASPVVPLFWNRADGWDRGQLHPTQVLNRNLDLKRVGLSGLTGPGFWRMPLRTEPQCMGAVRALLAQLLEEHDHAQDALELLLPRSGESLTSAFTRILLDLFGPMGLVVLEPEWLRSNLSRALAQRVAGMESRSDGTARESESESESVLPSESRFCTAADSVEPSDVTDEALVVHLGHAVGGRHGEHSEPDVHGEDSEHGERGLVQVGPLHAGGEGFRYPEESGSRTASELAAEIVQSPDAWCAGRLLEPAVEEACLPVCARVGDWRELDRRLAGDALPSCSDSLPRAAFVPRVGCTLLDPETEAALGRVGVDLAQALAARGSLGGASAAGGGAGVAGCGDQSASAPQAAELRAIAARARRSLLELKAELAAIDRSLPVLAKRTAGELTREIEQLADKVERVLANRSGKHRRHLRRVNHTLFPRGLAQENALGPLNWIARFGRGWIGTLGAELDPLGTEHLVLHLED